MGVTVSRLTDLLNLSHVPRWTTHPMAKPQSVAEHSYRTAIIAGTIYERYRAGKDWSTISVFQGTETILVWALSHDAPEVFTGDIPSPAKQQIGSRYLREIEAKCCPWWFELQGRMDRFTFAIVKIADTIEAYTWVAAYGEGIKCHWQHRPIEDQLRERIQSECASYEIHWPGITQAVDEVMEELNGTDNRTAGPDNDNRGIAQPAQDSVRRGTAGNDSQKR